MAERVPVGPRAGEAPAPARAWAAASAVAAWLLIVLGGTVSATGSGMGCGDHWPLCHGQVVPALTDPAVLLEYGHRLLAGVVAALTGLTALAAWRAQGVPGEGAGRLRALSGAALALVVVQSLLGAWTVFLGLSTAVSTLHLATAQLFFAVLVATMLAASPPAGAGEAPVVGVARLARLAGVTVALAFAVVVLGGYVKLSGAGLACGLTFPLCHGRVLPAADGPHGALVVVHWLHRLGAFALAGHVLALALRARRAGVPAGVAALAGWALALVVLQIGLGAATVWSRLAPTLSVAHLANGTLLFGVLTAVWVRARQLAAAVPAVAPAGGAAR